ncbi:ribonuclease Y [Candidatus Gottesmanbacteria bacterium]|nr:ribonuclease Y [Candidatus Gottesmanbacteria bacterium]
MFDVLKTLSGLVKPKISAAPHVKVAAPVAPPVKQETAAPAPKKAKKGSAPEPSFDYEAARKIAEAQAREIILEAKDESLRIRREAEAEIRRLESGVREREIAADRKDASIIDREKRLLDAEAEIMKKREEIEKVRQETITKLEKTAHMTRDEGKNLILTELRNELDEDVAREIKEAEAKAKEEAELKAREILVDAMKHGATDYVTEYTVSVIKVTDEEVKGRIIGKEGRNIRAFETATGVDVDLDEEGVIRLSSFDPVRREIARVTLERLLRDGRVQPGRIEELIEQVKKETERIMFEEGQKLCHSVGVYNLPPPLIATLGRFKYRYSFGQNMIAHTMEETKIGVAMAHEIGADVNVVRLGCLLHDIGKIVADKEGNHIDLGVELCKKYGLPQKVVDCVAQHHEDVPFTSTESMLVYIADAISGSRPGARYENYDEYVKRLKDLEAIAKSHPGVTESFAFQAGREIRVIVDPGTVSDATTVSMAKEIRDEIAKNVIVPGSVKVTVIRELRATETTK